MREEVILFTALTMCSLRISLEFLVTAILFFIFNWFGTRNRVSDSLEHIAAATLHTPW